MRDQAQEALITLIDGDPQTAGLMHIMESVTGCSSNLLIEASEDSNKLLEVLMKIHQATKPKDVFRDACEEMSPGSTRVSRPNE